MTKLTKPAIDLLSVLVEVERAHVRGTRADATVDAVELNQLIQKRQAAQGGAAALTRARVPYRDNDAVATALDWCAAGHYPLLPLALVIDAGYRFPDSSLLKAAFGVMSREDALEAWRSAVDSFETLDEAQLNVMKSALGEEDARLGAQEHARTAHRAPAKGAAGSARTAQARTRTTVSSQAGASAARKRPETGTARSASRPATRTSATRVIVQQIDDARFERAYGRFVKYIQEQMPVSEIFGQGQKELAAEALASEVFSNEYMDQIKEAQDAAWERWRAELDVDSWTRGLVGSGEIAARIQLTIDDPEATWIDRESGRLYVVRKLRRALGVTDGVARFESAILRFYTDEIAADAFLQELKALFTRQYAFCSHLLYLKDRTQYLPVAPAVFEAALKDLGVDLSLSITCTWASYSRLLSYLEDVRRRFAAHGVNATLRDAAYFLSTLEDAAQAEA